MGTYEIFTVGNGSVLVGLLTGVKLFLQSGMKSLLILAGLAGVIVALVRVIFNPRLDVSAPKLLLQLLFTILIVTVLLIQLHGNAVVTDVLDPTSRQEVVTDVPLGIVLPLWASSHLSQAITTMIETGYSLPDSSSILREGYLWHHFVLQRLLLAQLPPGDARQTLSSYLAECVFYHVIGDINPASWLDMNVLLDASDLLQAIRVEDYVRTTNVYEGGHISRTPVCTDAYDRDIEPIFLATTLGTANPDYARVIMPMMSELGLTDLQDFYVELTRAVTTLLGASSAGTGETWLANVLIYDVWREATMELANKDQNVVLAIRGMIGQMSREMVYQTFLQRLVWSKLLPVLRTLGEGALVILTPLMLAMLATNAGLMTVGMVSQLFVWLALWLPILAVLNILSYHGGIMMLRPFTGCTDSSVPESWKLVWDQLFSQRPSGVMFCRGITMRTYDAIKNQLLYVNSIGTMLAVASPVLAGALVRGGGNVLQGMFERATAAMPETGHLAKSAAAGQLQTVQYEGDGKQVIWSQTTGLYTTMDWLTGTQRTGAKGIPWTQVSGVEGSFTEDQFKRVVAGTRTRQLANGVTEQITGAGSVQRVTRTAVDTDNTQVSVTNTYGLNPDGTNRLVSSETVAMKDGLKVERQVDEQGNGFQTITGSLHGQNVEGRISVLNGQLADGTVRLSGQNQVSVKSKEGTKSLLAQTDVAVPVKDGQWRFDQAATRIRGKGIDGWSVGTPWTSSREQPMTLAGKLEDLLHEIKPGPTPGSTVNWTMTPEGQALFGELRKATNQDYERIILNAGGQPVASWIEGGGKTDRVVWLNGVSFHEKAVTSADGKQVIGVQYELGINDQRTLKQVQDKFRFMNFTPELGGKLTLNNRGEFEYTGPAQMRLEGELDGTSVKASVRGMASFKGLYHDRQKTLGAVAGTLKSVAEVGTASNQLPGPLAERVRKLLGRDAAVDVVVSPDSKALVMDAQSRSKIDAELNVMNVKADTREYERGSTTVHQQTMGLAARGDAPALATAVQAVVEQPTYAKRDNALYQQAYALATYYTQALQHKGVVADTAEAKAQFELGAKKILGGGVSVSGRTTEEKAYNLFMGVTQAAQREAIRLADQKASQAGQRGTEAYERAWTNAFTEAYGKGLRQIDEGFKKMTENVSPGEFGAAGGVKRAGELFNRFAKSFPQQPPPD